MIKLEKTNVTGWEAAIRGMRNPMNSWDKSDSQIFQHIDGLEIGSNDLKLMNSLAMAGTSHSKYRRMIIVTVDITAPLYWWKEFDTYKVGTVANSCSTMHKIHAKEFTFSDFSCDHLIASYEYSFDEDKIVSTDYLDTYCGLDYGTLEPIDYGGGTMEFDVFPIDILNWTIVMLNRARDLYLKTKDKKYWWQMIQLLPSSYNQKRTVQLNYEVLANIYATRKDHKLDEWRNFCEWIESLPYARSLITMEE